MQFSNTSDTSLGLAQDCRWLTGTDANSYLIADITRNINRHYYRAAITAWQASQDWEWDDANVTGFPIATTTLVNSQADYTVPTTALKILRVEVQDNGGDWHLLKPIDETQINVALDEFHETDGLPLYYRVTRRSVILYPAPDNGASVTLVNGLKIYFLREVDEFTTSDTTQEPGLPEPFHRILSLGAAYDFAIAKGLQNANQLKLELEQLMNEMKTFFGGRHRNFKTKLRPRKESYQ